jgi:hypothetical protein
VRRRGLLALARREGGFLLSNCHGLMHTVGRHYAHAAGVTLGTLMDHLPKDNDPGCSAGFAHGLVTAVAGHLDPAHTHHAAMVCAQAATRYQRYSCIHGLGHAFMRHYGDELAPALRLCRALGPQAAPDCAQGAYHDYWFAVIGADDATLSKPAVKDPRKLCAAQPRAFVRPCWYRAFLENRPAGFELESAEDLDGSATAWAASSAGGASPRRPSSARRTPRRSCGSAPTSTRPPTPPTASGERRCRTCSTGRCPTMWS